MAANEEPISTQQATPLLRQISEPHAEVLPTEPDVQEEAVASERRLASNYLVELVRNGNNSWAVTKPVGEACERETRTLCANEMRLMQMAFHDSNNRWSSPFVEEGLRNLHLCLATNSDALSPPCMDAMVDVFGNAARSGQPSPTAQWQPLPTGTTGGQTSDSKAKRHGGHKMRHRKHDADDDSSEDSKPIPQGLGIYVVNNNGNGEPTANGYAIGPWGQHDRHERHHHHGTHPLVWMVVLPFFCVGVFVTVKHAVAYAKKRHGGSLPFAMQSHEYEPLKVPDSPTQSLVDTAQYYGNEADVGRAIVDSGVPRSDVFVTSKHHSVDAWDYDTVLASVEASVAAIGGGYVDLFLLHAPGTPESRADAWRALEDYRVSNCGIAHINKLAETWRVKPAVDQFEVHPWLTRPELVEFCDKECIVIQAYCPLARMQRASDPVVVKIAEEVKATPAQVMLAWSMARGFVAIPKTVSAARLEQNLASCGVKLTKDQVAALDALDEYLVIAVWDPSKNDAI